MTQPVQIPATYRATQLPRIVDTGAAAPVVSAKPITLPAPERGHDLDVRVSAPATGDRLPIVIFSHGNGSSLEGYGPLADFWAARGFVVIQPTHLDSRTVSVPLDDPRYPRVWRLRVADITLILDHLDVLEAAVPGLEGRTDHTRIAVAGHSFGGHTAATQLGLQVIGDDEDYTDARIKAGVLIATAGTGGDSLIPSVAESLPYMNPTFAQLRTPTLVVAGDRDDLPFTVRGPEWLTDPYFLSPGAESLLTVFGGDHFLGGISGYEVAETSEEIPEQISLVQQVTWAYLRHALDVEQRSWLAAQRALSDDPAPLGRLESK